MKARMLDSLWLEAFGERLCGAGSGTSWGRTSSRRVGLKRGWGRSCERISQLMVRKSGCVYCWSRWRRR